MRVGLLKSLKVGALKVTLRSSGNTEVSEWLSREAKAVPFQDDGMRRGDTLFWAGTCDPGQRRVALLGFPTSLCLQCVLAGLFLRTT